MPKFRRGRWGGRGSGGGFVCESIGAYLAAKADALDRRSEVRTLGNDLVVSVEVGIERGEEPYDLEGILEYVFAVVEWVQGLRWSTPIADLQVRLWLTPFSKIWCPRSDVPTVVGKCEVNSGETAFKGSSRREVTVWRREDWSKVVIHELLHAFNWDRLVPQTPDNQSEALVELMALILHSQLIGGPHNWAAVLQRETEWTANQVKYLDRFPWVAQTSVRSYYILKAALLQNLRAFADWLRGPSPHHLRSAWPALVQHSLQNQIISIRDLVLEPRCVSMRMALHQLSLQPTPV